MKNTEQEKKYSKPLGGCDQSGADFTRRALQGSVVGGLNLDFITHHPTKGFIVIEFLLCEERQFELHHVTPHSSSPNRYWGKNMLKFLSLWEITKALNGTLYLVNYAKEGTRFADEVRIMEVEKIEPEKFRLNQDPITFKERLNLNFKEFSRWYIKLNKESLETRESKINRVCPKLELVHPDGVDIPIRDQRELK